MRPFPSGADYVAALQHTTRCFGDPQLRGAVPDRTPLGLPKPISGQFASVFGVTSTSGKRYAVKCFTRDVPDQARRYQAITNHLAPISQQWKVGFEYVPHGVLVDAWYPILKMDWVKATDLTSWIDGHLGDPAALTRLAGRFASLVAELAATGIGHGDLQHGNVLVTPDGDLRLVDYDGMYVPALRGLAATEFGHRNYQSPGRGSNDFGPDLDRFAAWIIYLSLSAVALDPLLWRQLRESGGECLLLTRQDLAEPSMSYRLGTLLRHDDPLIRDIAGQVRSILTGPLRDVPELQPIDLDSAASRGAAMSAPHAHASSRLPTWLSEHVAENTTPLAPARFKQRQGTLSGTGRTGLALFVPGAVLVAVGVAVGVAVLAFALLLILLFLGWSSTSFRRTPEAAQARAARTALREVRQFARQAEGEAEAAEKDTERSGKKIDKMRMDNAAAERRSEERHQQDLAAAKRETQRRLAVNEQKLIQVHGQQNKMASDELRQLQEAHLIAALSRQYISSASISGIGKKLTDSLRRAGISTAADFVRIQYVSGQRQNIMVYFVLRDGRQVHIEGIAEQRARALQQWRDGNLRRATATQPVGLPTAMKAAIADRFTRQTTQFTAERGRIEADERARMTALTKGHAAELTALRDETRRANAVAARERAAQDATVAATRQRAQAAKAKLMQTERDARAYQKIRYPHYLAFLITFRSNATTE
jgi:hypothetical protein